MRPVDTEIELKLTADPAALRQLLKAPAVTARSDGRGITRQLESVYYDTPDRSLYRRGISFRVRKTGRRFIQTVKTDDEGNGGGVKRRAEWEMPVASLAPDPAALIAPAMRSRLDGIALGDLAPVFATRIKRQIRLLTWTGPDGATSRIELVLDEGEVECPAGRQPIAELELELVEGWPAALYRLALELNAVAPLRVECVSKAARGYILAGIAAPGARKAGKLELAGDGTVGTAVGEVLRHCLTHWLANEPAVLDGHDPEGVHQMRVALRRLRSAMTLFRPVIPPADLDWLREETRWLAGSLGPARDWDVFLAELLAPVEAHRVGDSALAALRRAAEARRAAGYEGARAALLSPRYTVLVLRLGAWLEEQGWRAGTAADGAAGEAAARLDAPLQGFADHLLAARHRKVLKAGKGFARLTPPERHQVRIRLKKLRYAVEFFRSLYPGRQYKDYLDAMSGLQDTLGHLNDVSVAQHLLEGLIDGTAPAAGAAVANGAAATDDRATPGGQTAPDRAAAAEVALGAGLVIGWHSRGVIDLEPKVLADWRDFADSRPFWNIGQS